MDWFSDIKSFVSSADTFFDDMLTFDSFSGSDIMDGVKEASKFFKEDEGITARSLRAATKAFSPAEKVGLTEAQAMLNDGMISTTKPRGGAGETQPVGAVNPKAITAEWMERMRTFSQIQADTGVKGASA